MGHRWRRRPDRTSVNRWICQKCWSILVGGADKPENDMRLPAHPTLPYPPKPGFTCEELIVIELHET